MICPLISGVVERSDIGGGEAVHDECHLGGCALWIWTSIPASVEPVLQNGVGVRHYILRDGQTEERIEITDSPGPYLKCASINEGRGRCAIALQGHAALLEMNRGDDTIVATVDADGNPQYGGQGARDNRHGVDPDSLIEVTNFDTPPGQRAFIYKDQP